MVTMSIQEGLNELSTLEKRITKALTRRIHFGAVVIGRKAVNGYSNNEEFEKDVKSTYDSARALIKRRTLIKRAIVKKNAEVEVTIGGQTMTLAEAIERKNSIHFEEQLLHEMERQFTQLMNDLAEKKEYYRDRLDDHLTRSVGKENKEKLNINEDDPMLKFFRDENEPNFIDPINLRKEIDELDLSISMFKEKVDNVLTAANVKNDIEFDDTSVEDLSHD
ncbi:hypothetical protein BFG57_08390 [Bacillus solimangrovi]|uniref:Uncharacterized protein n=2 Tax=Bacillus solimangrovi TaxID=1305675 RepID=A0A1E5LK09_9BACI|nr:hypothetical protein BFG57_08390 [Bacillus solimangrovi]